LKDISIAGNSPALHRSVLQMHRVRSIVEVICAVLQMYV